MGRGARAAFAGAGALVDEPTGLVRIPVDVVEHALATAPSRFTVTPRNPARSLDVGGDRVAFGLVAGPPTVHDRLRGRRTGNFDDYVTLVKLAQCFDVIHFVGNQPTSPQELPAGTRHLDTYRANVTYTDRTFHCLAIGRDRTLDGIEMMAISRGLTLEQVVDDPCVLTIISVNSPRRFDEAMSDGLMAMAEYGQPAVITPFTLMGAMTPVTLAAALVAAERGGAGGDRIDAARPSGGAGRLWGVHVERRHAQRRARRSARPRTRGRRSRPDSSPDATAFPTGPATPARRTHSTRRPRTSRRCRSGQPCWAGPTSSTTAPGGWRGG